MGNAVLAYENHVDAAGTILTASMNLATLPPTNLRDARLLKIWRAAAGSAYIDVDAGAAVEWGVLGAFGLSLVASDTVRFQLSAVSPGAAEAYDSTALACNVTSLKRQFVRVLPSPVTARYLRATFTAAAGSIDVARLWGGPCRQMERNFDFGGGEKADDLSWRIMAEGTALEFIDIGERQHILNLPFNWLTSADRDFMQLMIDAVGIGRQVLGVPDPDGDMTRGPVLGRLVEVPEIVPRVARHWSAPLTIRETR